MEPSEDMALNPKAVGTSVAGLRDRVVKAIDGERVREVVLSSGPVAPHIEGDCTGVLLRKDSSKR